MSYTYPKPAGFLEWGEDDGSILVSAALTSASAIGGATVTGTATFNANGVLCGSAGAISWHSALTAAQRTKMQAGFTITCWVEKGYFSNTFIPAAEEWAIGLLGNSWNSWGAYKQTGAARLGVVGLGDGHLVRTDSIDKDDYVRLDMSFNGGGQTIFYVDKFPVGILNAGLPDTSIAYQHIGIGINDSNSGPQTFRIKNFMIRSRPVILPVAEKFRSVYAFGHSFFYLGDYAVDGDIPGDVNLTAPDDNYACAQIHRTLHSHGIGLPETKVRNTAIGGTFVSDFAAQITTAKTGNKKLKVALVQFGTNEVINITDPSLIVDYPNLSTDYQAAITSLVAAGCDLIFLGNTISTANDTTWGTASVNWTAYQQRTADMNAIHAAMVAANSQCRLVDLFTLFGGDHVDPNDFGLGGLHPSALGHTKIGRAFGKAMIAEL
jgi:lysophospholipase L1-like esterase